MKLTRLAMIFCLVALGGCTTLTAAKPLFAAADQGAPPIAQGMWTMRSASGESTPICGADISAAPPGCFQVDIRQQDGGLWRYHSVQREEDGKLGEETRQFALVPVNTKIDANGELRAYLLELRNEPPETQVWYLGIIPLGPPPSREFIFVNDFACTSILAEGPIPGVTAQDATATAPDVEPQASPDNPPHSVRQMNCEATTQSGAREAGRRAARNSLKKPDTVHLVFLGP